MKAQCPECGVEVVPEAVFCQKCGVRLEALRASQARTGGQGFTNQDHNHPRFASQRLRQAMQNPQEMNPQEELWQGHYSAKSMMGTWLLAILLPLAVAIVGILRLGTATGLLTGLVTGVLICAAAGLTYAYRRFYHRYELTGQKFIHHTGLIRRTTDRIEVLEISDVTFRQNLLQRIYGVGTIKIMSSDPSHPELWMRGIDYVQDVVRLIDDARRLERLRRGSHIESA